MGQRMTDKTTDEELTEDEMRSEDYLQLSSVYALLSRLWLQEVDMPLLEALNEPDMREAYIHMGGELPRATEQAIEDLAVDYCQLLIGPQECISPVQSVWEEKQFQGKPVASMQRYLESLSGYTPQSNVLDHIGVQLGFMAELFIRASAAENADAYEELAASFCADHFAWPGHFFDQVEARAQTDFYRGLARMSREFLEFELGDGEETEDSQ